MPSGNLKCSHTWTIHPDNIDTAKHDMCMRCLCWYAKSEELRGIKSTRRRKITQISSATLGERFLFYALCEEGRLWVAYAAPSTGCKDTKWSEVSELPQIRESDNVSDQDDSECTSCP